MACSAQHTKIIDFRSAAKYCDVKVRVGDQYFLCHRVILASASEYFDALFGGSFKEKYENETVLHYIDEETFEEVLRCVYNAEYKCESATVSVYKLLDASLFLRIRSLEMKCVSYIVKNVSSITNHIEIFTLAQSMKIIELIDVVSEYLVKNFDTFYDNKELLELSFDDVSFLLKQWSHAELYFKYESLMFHFIICWMRHMPVERRKYFMEVMGVVNFDALSSDYVTFMLQHNMENSSADLPNPGKKHSSLLGKRKLNSALPSASRNIEDLNRLLLKRKISEYFVGHEKSLIGCNPVLPSSFHDPTFYKSALGLHIFVNYDYYETTIQEDKVLSSNKYHPKWVVSGETNAWKNCKYRWTGFQAPSNLLYCMEIFEDKNNPVHCRQRFCTYSSADMKVASKILSFPPITLESKEIAMCAIPQGNIYLLDSQMSNGNFRPVANGQFSIEEISHGFYSYNCEMDKWFSAPPMESKQFYPCITADLNLIYSIGGWTEQERYTNIAQSFDYRAGKWMKLPNHSNDPVPPVQTICTVKEKVYISNGICIDVFDTIANKWERMNPPPVKQGISIVQKMLSYNDSLIVLIDDSYCSDLTGNDAFQIATYRPHSQDWHTCEYLTKAISKAGMNTEDNYYIYYDIKDIITFKM